MSSSSPDGSVEVDEEMPHSGGVDVDDFTTDDDMTTGDMTMGDMTTATDKSRGAISLVSKKYDRNNKGYLDETERALRRMDSNNLGYLTVDKLYVLMESLQNEQKKSAELISSLQGQQSKALNLKRAIIGLCCFAVLLALANVGTSFAAASLAKDTEVHGNELVIKGTNQRVATSNWLVEVSMRPIEDGDVSFFDDSAVDEAETTTTETTNEENTDISDSNVIENNEDNIVNEDTTVNEDDSSNGSSRQVTSSANNGFGVEVDDIDIKVSFDDNNGGRRLSRNLRERVLRGCQEIAGNLARCDIQGLIDYDMAAEIYQQFCPAWALDNLNGRGRLLSGTCNGGVSEVLLRCSSGVTTLFGAGKLPFPPTITEHEVKFPRLGRGYRAVQVMDDDCEQPFTVGMDCPLDGGKYSGEPCIVLAAWDEKCNDPVKLCGAGFF